jgi:hypothetical protein
MIANRHFGLASGSYPTERYAVHRQARHGKDLARRRSKLTGRENKREGCSARVAPTSFLSTKNTIHFYC